MGKKRAYSAKPSITSGDQCRASLPGLALLLSMGAASHRPHARSLRPNATKATGPNPVATVSATVFAVLYICHCFAIVYQLLESPLALETLLESLLRSLLGSLHGS